jgi:dihydroxyacetone kinase-like predicted kinase
VLTEPSHRFASSLSATSLLCLATLPINPLAVFPVSDGDVICSLHVTANWRVLAAIPLEGRLIKKHLDKVRARRRARG